jgi:2-haloacid dehalogenase
MRSLNARFCKSGLLRVLLHYSIVSTSIDAYHDLGHQAGATLSMAANVDEKIVSKEEQRGAFGKLKHCKSFTQMYRKVRRS